MDRILIAALLLAVATTALPAQDVTELRARLALLRASDAYSDPALKARSQRLALRALQSTGTQSERAKPLPATTIAWGRSGQVLIGLQHQADADAVAAAVDSALNTLGVPPSTVERLVVVEADLLIGHRLAGSDARVIGSREILPVGVPGGRSTPAVVEAEWRAWAAEVAISKIGSRLTPDAMRPWTGDLTLLWDPSRSATAQLRELVESEATSAHRCLGGDPDACSEYLGIDVGADPVRRRFSRADAQRLAPAYAAGRDPLRARQCEGGAVEECYRILERYGPLSASSSGARESMVMLVMTRLGAQGFHAVLADSASRLGARLARATGQSPSELGAAWREWLLANARVTPVQAGARELASTLLTLALLLALSTRSGRWFA